MVCTLFELNGFYQYLSAFVFECLQKCDLINAGNLCWMLEMFKSGLYYMLTLHLLHNIKPDHCDEKAKSFYSRA